MPSSAHPFFAIQGDNLNRSAVRSSAQNLFARGFSIVSQFLTFVILARLLAPADFGLVAMAMPVIAILMIVGDLGLSKWTVQADQISEDEASSLFFLSVLSGFAIATACFAVAPLLAWLYDEDRVTGIVWALSSQFVLMGFRSQHKALMQRSFRFGELVNIEIASAVGSTILAIWIAWYFETYWAYVVRFLAQALIQTLGVWFAAKWMPKMIFWTAETSRMLKFGGAVMGGLVVNTLGRQMDNVLIGWRWGEAALGSYAFAYRIFLMPVQQLSNPLSEVLIPAISRLRNSEAECRKLFSFTLKVMGLVAAPPFAALAIYSEEIITMMVGSEWLAAAPILRVLAPLGAFHVFYSPIGWLMLAYGRADRYLRWTSVLTPIFILSFFLGLPWGGFGVACAYTGANALIIVPSWYYGTRDTAVRVSDILLAVVPAALVGVSTASICAVLKFSGVVEDNVTSMAFVVGIVGFSWVLGLIILVGFSNVRKYASVSEIRALFHGRFSRP